MMKLAEDFKATIVGITDQINNLKYLTTHKYSPKTPDRTTVVTDNRRNPALGGG